MKGWKTWAGAILIGVAAALEALGESEWSKVIMMAGSSLGLIGLGHKLEKGAR